MAPGDFSNYQGVYTDLNTPAVIIGGIFALIALVLSVLLIFQHLKFYTNPAEQKWIVGVLFMVPVYAVESFISLWNPIFSFFCDILRNCYEAFAMYSFGRYLVACLGGEQRAIELLENESRKQLSEPLLQCEGKQGAGQQCRLLKFFCRPSVLGKDLYSIVKFGLVQYMILKTLCSFLALVLEFFDVYGDGEFKWYYGYPYIAAVLNFSQMWALYCLVQFYNVTHERLQPIRPLAKFISFKAIVFATWWQGVGIAIMCALGILPKSGKFRNGLQDFLICIEMAVAAVAHIFVFSAEPYRFVSVTEPGKATIQATKAELKMEKDGEEKRTILKKESHVEAPGTSVTESVQDIVIGGGEHVVKDVVLTMTQAMEPVERGAKKIHETFHHVSLGSDREAKTKVEIDEHVKKEVNKGGSDMVSSEKKLNTGTAAKVYKMDFFSVFSH